MADEHDRDNRGDGWEQFRRLANDLIGDILDGGPYPMGYDEYGDIIWHAGAAGIRCMPRRDRVIPTDPDGWEPERSGCIPPPLPEPGDEDFTADMLVDAAAPERTYDFDDFDDEEPDDEEPDDNVLAVPSIMICY